MACCRRMLLPALGLIVRHRRQYPAHAPLDLPPGPHEVMAVVYNADGKVTSRR